jgi:mono/diheme cytochrome c family protein
MKSSVILALALASVAATLAAATPGARVEPLPQRLAATGLFVPGSTRVAPDVIAFSPQYPLWSDGTRKRRWIQLPPGASIDASRVDAWDFPVGTKVWKEFGYGKAIETRLIERVADGSWRFATYVWNAEGTDAELAPQDGTVVPVADAPGGRYAVPGRGDCAACHEGPAVPVLGFSALQLSPDRDPLAPHADPQRADQADLRILAARGVLRGLPAELVSTPPRIEARTPTERAALGYLHGNCGHCHNAAGALTGLELVLAQQAQRDARSAERTLQSLLGHSSRFRPNDAQATQRIAAGHGSSVLTLRMKTNNRLARMPPLGVQVVDTEGVALIERWIASDLQSAPSNLREASR